MTDWTQLHLPPVDPLPPNYPDHPEDAFDSAWDKYRDDKAEAYPSFQEDLNTVVAVDPQTGDLVESDA